MLHRHEGAADARRAADVRARRGGRRRRWAPSGCARTTTPSSIPSTSSTKAASAAATCSRAGKLVFGISVAEKKIMWLQAARRGCRRPRLAAARQEPERAPDGGALAPVRASRSPRRRFPVVDTMKQRIGGAARRQQVQQRDPALDDLADQPALGRRRSAEGQRDPVGRRGDARLPRAAGHARRSSGSRSSSGAWPIRRSRSR